MLFIQHETGSIEDFLKPSHEDLPKGIVFIALFQCLPVFISAIVCVWSVQVFAIKLASYSGFYLQMLYSHIQTAVKFDCFWINHLKSPYITHMQKSAENSHSNGDFFRQNQFILGL